MQKKTRQSWKKSDVKELKKSSTSDTKELHADAKERTLILQKLFHGNWVKTFGLDITKPRGNPIKEI